VDLEKFPRVEFWNDTQWEAYKEDVQSEIRREMNNDGKDLEK
jgi:DNA-binding transcriptional regulator/RsmH inhibitor MraZ